MKSCRIKRNAKVIAVDWSLVDGQWKSLSIRQIAEKLGTTYPVVFARRKELNRQALTGLPAQSFRPVPTGRRQWDTDPAEALGPIMNNRQIAQKLGIPYYAVHVKRNELIQDAIRNRQPTAPYQLQVVITRGTDLSRPDGLWSRPEEQRCSCRFFTPLRILPRNDSRHHENSSKLRIEILLRLERWKFARVLAEFQAIRFPDNPNWWIRWAYALRHEKSIEHARGVLWEAARQEP